VHSDCDLSHIAPEPSSQVSAMSSLFAHPWKWCRVFISWLSETPFSFTKSREVRIVSPQKQDFLHDHDRYWEWAVSTTCVPSPRPVPDAMHRWVIGVIAVG
jgi:hypothetical protein